MNYKRIQIILSIMFVIFFLSIPLSSAERYKQIEITLNYNNQNTDVKEQINMSNRTSEQYSNYNLTWQHFTSPHKDELISKWKFEETSKTASVYDSVGNNHGVYPTDCDPDVNGVEGSGVKFTHNYPIEVSNFNFGSTTNLTTGGYFKTSTLAGAPSDHLIRCPTKFYLDCDPDDNELQFGIKQQDGIWKKSNITFTPTLGTWYYVLATARIGEPMKIYVNHTEGTYDAEGRATPDDNFQSIDGDTVEIGNHTRLYTLDEWEMYSAYFTDEEVENLEGNPKGAVSCAMLPPTKAKIDDVPSGSTQSVVQFTTFSHREIMEGSSIHWWRAPFERINDDVEIKLTIYETSSLRQANVTYGSQDADGWYELTPEWVADPRKIYEQTYDINGDNDYAKIDSINTFRSETNFTYQYNFTYVKAFAPVYSNSNYMVVWQWQESEWDGSTPTHLFVTQSDVGNNDYYYSLWHLKGTTYYPPIDTLTDVLFEYGLSSKVAGVTTTDTGTSDPSIEFNTTVELENNNNQIAFDSNDDGYIYVKDGTPNTFEEFSISCFIKEPTVSANTIFVRWNKNDASNIIELSMDTSGRIHLYVFYQGLATDEIRTDDSYDDDGWHNIVGTRAEDGTLDIYIDGVDVATTIVHAFGTGSIEDVDEVIIGGREGTNFMDGRIDDVRLYMNRTLNIKETENITEGRAISRFNLIHWFPFDDDGDYGDTADDNSTVQNAVSTTLSNGVVNSSTNASKWVLGYNHESYIDQDIFTFTFPFTSPDPVAIDVTITISSTSQSFSYNTNDFILISECSSLWLDGNSTSTHAIIEIDVNRSVGVWLMDNHEYGQNYSRTISNVYLNRTQEIRTIGFIPYHTVEVMSDTLFNEKPSTFGLQLPPKQVIREKRENQKTWLQIAGEVLYVYAFKPILKTLKYITDLASDALAGAGHYVLDKLTDFGEWFWNNLKDIGAKIWEPIEWLVNASAWLLYSMLRVMLNVTAFLLFMVSLVITFKFTNYWILVGTKSFKEANDYLAQNVQEGVAVATAVATKGASVGASISEGASKVSSTAKRGASKVKSKISEWRNR